MEDKKYYEIDQNDDFMCKMNTKCWGVFDSFEIFVKTLCVITNENYRKIYNIWEPYRLYIKNRLLNDMEKRTENNYIIIEAFIELYKYLNKK